MMLRRHHPRPDVDEQSTDGPPPPSGDDNGNGPDDIKRPARSASKAEWIAYAVALGAEQDDAEQLTRDQLAEQYGTEG
ncbi:hypothetical protein [Streptomyces sp. WAC01280]|uniref:hypothetical protein n=1 Tax=Streptomyces sp. WAC01280 TaxID=2487424 RepID=UPI000F776066|nr:hypothetical protein [Streptomyces sp. WAC01280]RSS59573.1 hypothetical protein EF909_06760 [Streptomyces sp. WAC01280]